MGSSPAVADALDRLLDERLPFRDATTEAFLPALLCDPEATAAVVFYGSRRIGGAPPDSEPDFYVIVDGLRRYHRARAGLRWVVSAALNLVLPPSTYHVRIASGATAKACLITLDQLRRETSVRAADLHHVGRFSKRIGLSWARDGQAARRVLEAQRSSLEVMADHALALLGERFDLDEFALTLLGLSYRGEPRVAEPGKVRRIFEADRDHYRAVARLLLGARSAVTLDEIDAVRGSLRARDARMLQALPRRYRQPAPSLATRRATLRIIARSRTRALLRWPKHLLTFDGWLDYALRKIERQGGRRVGLSARERRHPLLFGWPTLFGLWRDGVVR